MISAFNHLLELFNGEAYCPHPADAALPLGRRFQGKTIVVIGGGGTGTGWTQRVRFDRQGLPELDGHRSIALRRGTVEWGEHLLHQAQSTSGWALLLIEQQWQAAISPTSATSLNSSGVEQMLRVRDAVSDFGDDRMAEDAIRVAVDHPTMQGSVVGGVRLSVLEPLEKEARANGFQIAGIRIAVFALLERHLAKLQKKGESPSCTIVAYDGQSALIVGVREGAFDTGEGALSYLVNRPPYEVRTQVAKRIGSPSSLKEWNGRVEIIGTAFSFESGRMPEGIDVRQEPEEVLLAAVDEKVRHDLRSELQEMRLALPRWVRGAVYGVLLVTLAAVVGTSVQLSEAFRLDGKAAAKRVERDAHLSAAAGARNRIEQLKKEEVKAHQIADWVDRNYHAQALVHALLTALPTEVSLDALSIQASEGLPQAKLKFTLLGSEEAQRSALRSVEEKLYQLGYEVGRRDDPTSSSTRRGGVVYAWDLILPSFGAESGHSS